MRTIIGAPLLLALSSFLALEAHGEFFYRGWTDHYRTRRIWDLGMEVGLYSAQQNFDPYGRIANVQDLSSYQRIQMSSEMAYGLSTRWSVYGILSWARVQLGHSTLPGETFGLTDQVAGVTYRALNRDFLLDLQAEGSLPAYSNASQASNVPYLGDGSVDLTAGAFGTLSLKRDSDGGISLTVGSGFTYRTSYYSSSLPWSLTLRFTQFQSGFWGSLGLEGVYSLQTDTSQNNPLANRGTSTGSGGLYATNTTNASIINGRGKVGYQFSPEISLNATLLQALNGRNIPVGTSVFLGLDVRLGQSAEKKSPLQMTPSEYGKANQGFINYSNEAKVIQANDRLNMIKINKGSNDGIRIGQIFDIFNVKEGSAATTAVARAKVSSVKPAESILTIVEYFKEIWIEEGFLARQPIQ